MSTYVRHGLESSLDLISREGGADMGVDFGEIFGGVAEAAGIAEQIHGDHEAREQQVQNGQPESQQQAENQKAEHVNNAMNDISAAGNVAENLGNILHF